MLARAAGSRGRRGLLSARCQDSRRRHATRQRTARRRGGVAPPTAATPGTLPRRPAVAAVARRVGPRDPTGSGRQALPGSAPLKASPQPSPAPAPRRRALMRRGWVDTTAERDGAPGAPLHRGYRTRRGRA